MPAQQDPQSAQGVGAQAAGQAQARLNPADLDEVAGYGATGNEPGAENNSPGAGESTERGRASGPLAAIAYTLGGIGLLGATGADALAVAGRHTGLHLLGSIELVQACVVLLGASAMLIATLTGNHASVHILTERLAAPTVRRLARVAALLGALAFALLATGSIWVARDLWGGFEQTELLHIPLRWLRVAWIGFAVVISARFFRNAVRGAA